MLGAMANLIQLAYATFAGFHAVGHEQLNAQQLCIVRDARVPNIYDANFAHRVRAQTEPEIEAVLKHLDEAFADYGHRHVLWDPDMPAACEARLVVEGYRPHNPLVSLVLEGPMRSHARPPQVDIRPATTDADWDSIAALKQSDHEEQLVRGFHFDWPQAITDEMTRAKRCKHDTVHYVIARAGDVDCGFFSAWPGQAGTGMRMGMVEDLFTHPDYRGRGIGSALIAACVEDARARGASCVLVSPLGADTPKHMYAALGFRPLCVQRSYLRDDAC
jgi:GNAT superfamily N-acetyltransferase